MKMQAVGTQPMTTELAPTVQPSGASNTNSSSDFTALLMQLVNTAQPAEATGLPAAVSEVLQRSAEKDEPGEEDAATSELVMVLAALTSIPIDPPRIPLTNTGEGGVNVMDLTGESTPKLPTSLLTGLPEQKVEELLTSSAEELLQAESQTTSTTEIRSHANGTELIRETRTLTNTGEPVVTRHMQSHVGTQPWSDELGAQVTWLAERGHQAASIRLTPEHLGPMEVRIAIKDDQASVWFGASNADTRAAIENALPRLREMLAGQGLSLADAGVFREPPQQQQPHVEPPRSSGNDAEPVAERQPTSTMSVKLIDTYA